MHIALNRNALEMLSMLTLLLGLRNDTLGASGKSFVITDENVRGREGSHPSKLVAFSEASFANPLSTRIFYWVGRDDFSIRIRRILWHVSGLLPRVAYLKFSHRVPQILSNDGPIPEKGLRIGFLL